MEFTQQIIGGAWILQFQEEGFDFFLNATTWHWTREYKRKTRIYVTGHEDVDFEPAYAMAKERYAFLRGTDDETDKMFDSLNRKLIGNMRAFTLDAVQKVHYFKTLVEDNKIHFSRKAGCSCGCSPGFILDKPATVLVNDPFSGWVTAVITDIHIGKAK